MIGPKGLLLADEVFSTASAEDQYRLILGARAAIIGRAAKAHMVTHSTRALEQLETLDATQVYHFAINSRSEAEIEFLYKLKSGADESHSLAVGSRAGLPNEVIEYAKRYLEGDVEAVDRVLCRIEPVIEYTDSEKASLRSKSKSLRAIFGAGDELIVDRGIVRWRHGVGDYSNQYLYDMDAQFRHFVFPGRVISEDRDLTNMLGHVNLKQLDRNLFPFLSAVITRGGIPNVSELKERQMAIRELRRDEILRPIGAALRELRSSVWQLSSCGDLEKNRMWAKSLLECPGAELWAYAFEAGSPSSAQQIRNLAEILPVCIRAGCILTDLSPQALNVEALEKDLLMLFRYEELIERLGLPIFNLRENLEDHPEAYKEAFRLAAQAERELSFSLQATVRPYPGAAPLVQYLLQAFRAQLPEVPARSFWEIPADSVIRAAQTLAPITKRDFPGSYDFEGLKAARRIVALGSEQDHSERFLEVLRSSSSVHLNQLANHFSVIFRAYQGEHLTGQQVLLAAQSGKPNNNHDWQQIFGDCLYRESCVSILGELHKVEQLIAFADSVSSGIFCEVDFDGTGEINIEGGFLPTMESTEQVRNRTTLPPSIRCEFYEGANMSGKTFDMKRNGISMLMAHALGYAPARSMTTPFFRRITYLDRVTSFSARGGGSFESEAHYWREILEHSNKGASIAFVDEAFSTVSPKYQDALCYGVVMFMLKRGDPLFLATHAHNLLDALEHSNGSWINIMHFKSDVAANGDIKFSYEKSTGRDQSKGLAVARHLGLPVDILEAAARVS